MRTSGEDETALSPLSANANNGKIALVTGGGTGIGRAIALELSRTGAEVAIAGRRPEPLAETRELIESAGGVCLDVPTDVREPDQVDALLDRALERFDRIDVLVNNAGGQFQAPAEDVSLKGWRAVQRLNSDAVWDLTSKTATRSMIRRRSGLIVFLGFSPRRGLPGFVHASAARAALENLASGLSNEWSRFGIRAVCVACGLVDTPALANYGGDLSEWERQIPLGRATKPEEVGSLVAYLATEAAASITGTTIAVDGGADAWGLAQPPPPRQDSQD
jgi:NAD(P)-dependent dehydrogenase (short-subunit alcohol dehydrogenase family)